MSQYEYEMESSSIISRSPLLSSEDDFSTGYLQDVLFQFSSKRRRLLLMPTHDQFTSDFDANLLKNNCWTPNMIQDCCQDFDSTLNQITRCHTNSDVKTPEEAVISETYYDSSSSSQKESSSAAAADHNNLQWSTPADDQKENLYCIDPIFHSSGVNNNEKIRKKRVLSAKVVYPFAVVKPGGIDGDVTLNDINERMLMPPTRPVKHPVGDFACRPLVSPEGPGLSGKAVVAFTRLHTPGRGTITIIRTKD